MFDEDGIYHDDRSSCAPDEELYEHPDHAYAAIGADFDEPPSKGELDEILDEGSSA